MGNTESKEALKAISRPEDSSDIREWKRPTKYKRGKAKDYILYASQFNNKNKYDQLYSDTLKYRNNREIALMLNWYKKTIWKMLPKSDEQYDPMIDFISNYCKNIEVRTKGSLEKLLSHAIAFVCDSPSTSYYDAIDMGVPTLCLRPATATPMRDSAKKMFGGTYYRYKDLNSMRNRLDIFLKNVYYNTNLLEYPIIKRSPDLMPWEE